MPYNEQQLSPASEPAECAAGAECGEGSSDRSSQIEGAGGTAPTSSRKEKERCQVEGCDADLAAEGKAYCLKRRLCTEHMRADAVQRREHEGMWRFCFQCGKLEPLSRFEGLKRSCRARLQQRKQRETRRCSSDVAYRYNRAKQQQMGVAGRSCPTPIDPGLQLMRSLMPDMPDELLPQALLQLQEEDEEGDYDFAAEADGPPVARDTREGFGSFISMFGGSREELLAQMAAQHYHSMPLPAVMRCDSAPASAAAAAAVSARSSSPLMMMHGQGSFGTPCCGFPAAPDAAAALQEFLAQQQQQVQAAIQATSWPNELAPGPQPATLPRWAPEQCVPAAPFCSGLAGEAAPAPSRCLSAPAAANLSGPATSGCSGPAASGCFSGRTLSGPAASGCLSGPLPGCGSLSGPSPSSTSTSPAPCRGFAGAAVSSLSAPLPAVQPCWASAAAAVEVAADDAKKCALLLDELLAEYAAGPVDEELPYTDIDLRSMLENALETAAKPQGQTQQQQQQQRQVAQQQAACHMGLSVSHSRQSWHVGGPPMVPAARAQLSPQLPIVVPQPQLVHMPGSRPAAAPVTAASSAPLASSATGIGALPATAGRDGGSVDAKAMQRKQLVFQQRLLLQQQLQRVTATAAAAELDASCTGVSGELLQDMLQQLQQLQQQYALIQPDIHALEQIVMDSTSASACC